MIRVHLLNPGTSRHIPWNISSTQSVILTPGVSPGMTNERPRHLNDRDLARFEDLLLPHLDAAYTLARYLTRDPHDVDDVVQDAFLRALKYWGSFKGGDARAWLLTIVRNVCHSMWGGKKPVEEFDEELHGTEDTPEPADARALRADTRETLRQALDTLPLEFREVLVLREIQGLSYEEITQIAQIPMGTVMSRLSRARTRLERALQGVTP